ncbi:hypothetical protein MMC25_003755 [Agyrium rufum]|nr:hypothetical protein [Agyrium rufum]
MHKTLLLCFIHGFKGGDDTFGGFPDHIRVLLANALPKITVSVVTYPKYETRGDLKECVTRFRDWLQNLIIDLEVANGTPSPTVDPSVRVILCGHSMGGIVAAETLLSITSETPLPHRSKPKRSTTASSTPSTASTTSEPPSPVSPFFPYIQGILALDTPYLGINPSVVAHGAESHLQTASTAYNAISELSSAFGWGGAAAGASAAATTNGTKPGQKAIAAGPSAAKEGLAAAAVADPNGSWGRWGKYAMFAGAASAVAAAGSAAYLKRDTITEGWTWASSHLEFVGCLVRGEELKTRLTKVAKLERDSGIGFKDLVTVLGRGATSASGSNSGTSTPGKAGETAFAGGLLELEGSTPGGKRTFCAMPRQEELRPCFEGVVFDKAADETSAHMNMFERKGNPGYFFLLERARTLLVEWVDKGWYEGSDEKKKTDTVAAAATEKKFGVKTGS